MRSLKTREAAAVLNISTNTLRTWERKFGFPKPLRSPGRHRTYTYAEIVALRDALRRGLSVPSAISAVREGLGADMDALVNALDCFNLDAADRAMEASLALRSLERSVDEVLLPALDDIRRREGAASAIWSIAHQWGIDWLRRARRLIPPSDSELAILIGDASLGPGGSAGPSLHALALFCQRGGVEVFILPVVALERLEEAVHVIEPVCLVVAGRQASDDQVARWTYAVRRHAGSVPVALYLRPTKPAASEREPIVLSAPALDAQREVLELVAAGRRAKQGGSDEEANGLAHTR